mmetsp:Transcript_34361/g.63175  ORF Transcript_34361/g.63175 Transcript_34361/m.63175 type:complete len:188 (+) Transcript_34361:38-601(+)
MHHNQDNEQKSMADDLIVDFPSRGRRLSNCKSVRFSETVDVQLFERRIEVHRSELWYSESDYGMMKIANRRAVRDVRRTFLRQHISASDRASSGCDDSNDHDDSLNSTESECLEYGLLTGLERFLLQSTIKKTHSGRTGCYVAVLAEQGRQARARECDPQKIRRASRRHTEWARKRAHTIGTLNARR